MNDPAPAQAVSTPVSFRSRLLSLVHVHRWQWWLNVALLIAAALAVHYVARKGLEFRRWTYENSRGLRHQWDINHNFAYGKAAVDDGWLNVYGDVLNDPNLHGPGRGNRRNEWNLDYVPLRLLVMRQWVATVYQYRGPVERWEPDYDFTKPLLQFMTSMEALTAVGVFLLIRLWIRREYRQDQAEGLIDRPMSPWRGFLPGLIGAMLVWFNPASVFSAHVWPSSDCWVPAFFIWGVLAASCNAWFIAGLIIVAGGMMKGQQMIAAPLFVLWPLLMGKPGKALRFASGFVFGWGVIVGRWMIRDEATRQIDTSAVMWVSCVALAALLLIARKRFINRRWIGNHWVGVGIVASAVVLIAWPLVLQRNHPSGIGTWWATLLSPLKAFGTDASASLTVRDLALPLIIAAAVFGWFAPWRKQFYLAAAMIGAALIFCPVFFSGDLTWYKLGFQYGSEKFAGVHQGSAVTLPTLLNIRFGWNSWEEMVTIWPGSSFLIKTEPIERTLKSTMIGLYAVGLLLASIGLARHTLRPDRRFLVGVAAVWMCAYAFVPQMHARYLLFPATVMAVLAGVNFGGALLALLPMGLAWCVTFHISTGQNFRSRAMREYLGDDARSLWSIASKVQPDAAWAIALLAAMLAVWAVTSKRRYRWDWISRAWSNLRTAVRLKPRATTPD